MNDNDNPALPLLRQMDGKLDRIAEDVVDLTQRVTLLEGQYASISHRLDWIAECLGRIERRLEAA
jgi:hypothetical protein